MGRKIAGVSDDAVVDATGEPWDHWLDLLDDRAGTDADHRDRVAALAEAGVESGWWQQQLAVGYERERGLREVGETADGGYQVGVQRTFGVDADRLWAVLTAPDGVAAWLDVADPLAFEPGETYETVEGVVGEVRTVAEGERVRSTWRPAGREAETTLQVTLTSTGEEEPKTALRFHHEKLSDADEREAMRERWRAALDRIETLLEAETDG